MAIMPLRENPQLGPWTCLSRPNEKYLKSKEMNSVDMWYQSVIDT